MKQAYLILSLGFFVFVVAFFRPIHPARADEVKLKNGDRLTGTLLSVSEGRIRFQTNYAGVISFPWAEVAFLKTDRPFVATLNDGEEFVGWIEPSHSGTFRVTSRSSTLDIRSGELSALRLPTEEQAAMITAAGKPPRWESELEAGVQAHSGTVNSKDFHLGIQTRRTTRDSELSLKASGAYSKSGGERTADQAFGEARLDRFHTPRLYSTYLLDLERDAIQDLDLRATENVAVGYRFIRTPATLLQGDVGGGMIEEYFHGDRSRVNPVGRLGGRLQRKVGERSEFRISTVYLPILSNIRQYRLRGESSFTTPVTVQFQLRLSLVDRFDSNPQPGVKKNDLTFRSSVVWDF